MKFNFLKKYMFLSPWEYTVGNAAEHIFYGLLTAKIKQKKLVIIVRQESFLRQLLKKPLQGARVTNKEIFKVESEGIIIPSDSFLPWLIGKVFDYVFIPFYIIHRVLRKIFKRSFRHFFAIPTLGHSIVYNPDGVKKFSWEIVERYKWDKVLKEGVPVYINRKKEKEADIIRERMGLPSDSWYVALHVRETGFYGESEDEAGYRSAHIANYMEGIKYVVDSGGWVVRMGDRTMTPLPPMDRVIDYPFTPYKSDLMDLYLIQNCRLYIGMDSGIWDVAHMYQKRSILVNVTNWCLAFPPYYGDLGILKHIYSKSKGRFLSIRECLEAPYTINYHYGEGVPDLARSDYIIFENLPWEIRELVAEKLSKEDDYRYSELQSLFVEKRREQIKRWMRESPFLTGSAMQSYRLSTRYYYEGTVAQKFLEDNWEFGEYLERLTERLRRNGLRHL